MSSYCWKMVLKVWRRHLRLTSKKYKNISDLSSYSEKYIFEANTKCTIELIKCQCLQVQMYLIICKHYKSYMQISLKWKTSNKKWHFVFHFLFGRGRGLQYLVVSKILQQCLNFDLVQVSFNLPKPWDTIIWCYVNWTNGWMN